MEPGTLYKYWYFIFKESNSLMIYRVCYRVTIETYKLSLTSKWYV